MRGWNPIEIEYFEPSSKRIHAWRGSTVSTKVDTHQEQQETVEGGVVSDCGVSAAWMPRPSP
jgi:hypothetical protein